MSTYLCYMRLGPTIFHTLKFISIASIYSLSNSDFISHVNSIDYSGTERSGMYYYPDRTIIPQTKIDNNMVEIVKSFKNSSGFYKINGTLENQGAVILSDIKVIKYYKIPSVNDSTLVCYEQNIVNCQYKSNDNQLPPKSYFLIMPPAPPTETNITAN